MPFAVTAGDAATGTAPSLGSAPNPDPAAAGTISDQVAGQLVRMVSSGPQDMVMRLHPPELGDLTVRVAVSGRDVSAWFASPLPHVQSAISTAIGQLQTSLGNAGYNLNGAWVGGGDAGARQQQNAPAPLPSALREAPSAATVRPAPLASQPTIAGLNVYV
jgi:flagellar hook-length control protein FliK